MSNSASTPSVKDFLANGGKITVVEEGVRASNERDLYRQKMGIADVDKKFGGTLTDRQLLAYREAINCE